MILLKERVHLDLIGKQRRIEHVQRPIDCRGLEVRHPDVSGHALLDEFVERRERVFGIVVASRPVDVQQIDRLDAQSVEAIVGRLDDALVAETR